jgi:N utilization substance protein B
LSKRRRAREMAIQMLYQSDLGQESCDRVLKGFKPGDYLSEESDEASAESPRAVPTVDSSVRNQAELDSALEYAKTLVRGTLEHLEHIDKLIRQQAEHWRLERMPPVDRNILRLAVYEFLFETDVPKLVILDEAIELAKGFGTEQSGRFVNGVLDGILKSHSLPGSLT